MSKPPHPGLGVPVDVLTPTPWLWHLIFLGATLRQKAPHSCLHSSPWHPVYDSTMRSYYLWLKHPFIHWTVFGCLLHAGHCGATFNLRSLILTSIMRNKSGTNWQMRKRRLRELPCFAKVTLLQVARPMCPLSPRLLLTLLLHAFRDSEDLLETRDRVPT